MANFGNKLYTGYAALTFTLLFLFFLPLIMVAIHVKGLRKLGLAINRWWAKLFFMTLFIPVTVERRGEKLDRNRQYIFCSNHFSFLDIPTLGYTPVPFKFIGKSSIKKVPLFGYMFSKMHIPVDRERLRSKYNSLKLALQTLDDGFSLTIYPEGGIYAPSPPEMARFKEGAFRAAIEKGAPIVPVTVPFNHRIFPDDGKFHLRWGRCKIIFHEPIETAKLNLDDVKTLKNKVFDVIQGELNAQNNQIKAKSA